jgi:hypothetical protein
VNSDRLGWFRLFFLKKTLSLIALYNSDHWQVRLVQASLLKKNPIPNTTYNSDQWHVRLLLASPPTK